MSNVKKMWCELTALLLALVMVCCSLLSCPCRTHAAFIKKTSETDIKEISDKIIVLVNEERAKEGLKPLKAVPYLNDKARERAREAMTKFSHYRPRWDGKPDDMDNVFFTIIDENLIPWSRIGENLAGGYETAEETIEQWRGSPDHWKAIMDPNYTHIGVGGGYEKNSAYGYYWCQIFVEYDRDKYGPLDNEYIPERYKTVPVDTGDINGDGEINSFDLITLNRYLAGVTELNDLQIASADTLKDGTVTSADATILRRYILGKYKSLPVTMDMLGL
ncbi:CAP domain-containing protein [Ruminococcus flavefaciens]|jgi:uncharacterized protein YkwD|uniref:Dockerin type I repeat-containing protein n=1 Tax=Ruminococcus flavefaciens TaxID=1265 RepID=A0A1K1N394_RUMFL|nr:CAP domain-containing protein [Ruminococcus flavefaciens]SFW29717.1 Dockerin type I repeat-containing protein [Ruminococcus flavefaciens]